MNMRIASLVLLSFLLALAACEGDAGHDNEHHHHEHHAQEHDGHDHGADVIWTCPMHPQIERNEAGTCPICGMRLVQRDHEEHEPGVVHVPTGIQQTMNIRTAEVQRDRLWRRIDTVGRVDYDESGLSHVHPRVEGWINALHVSAAGDYVESGELLFTLYSSDLINAQEELLQALRSGDPRMIRASRERLRALDVQPEVIEQIERRREVKTHVPWRARQDAYVTALGVRQGMYVAPGTEIMALADLSRVWLIADVFERQSSWLERGQPVEIGLPNAPGERREGEIEYIYPELDATTRSVRVRVPFDNQGQRLKPGMWASVTIYAGAREDLVIMPREALIRTGQAARVVLVDDEAHFRVREVVAGMESGDWVEIREGLEPGDKVVVSGQFLIDSEASLRAGHGRLEHQH
jgi:Cu(I)/Ag(I) efflux system membrane fusion protein